jgi:glycerate-2-kinase
VTVVAFGKCAAAMMAGALEACVPARAMVVAPPGPELSGLARRGVRVLVGNHPHPAPDAAQHGREVMDTVARTPADGTVLALVSGGGSSLLEVPAAGVELTEIRAISEALMLAGATIEELNAVRRALSDVKGGRLAAAARARVWSLVCEDVPGRPELVASGPTVPPPSGPDARAVVAKFGVAVSEAAARAMRRAPVTLASSVEVEVVADNESARRALIRAGRDHGLAFRDLGIALRGEAREAGRRIVAEAGAAGCPVVCGGETTVTVRGRGRGGRNQELVLAAYLARPEGLVCAFGTDGIDGRSDHAGAFLDGATWSAMSEREARARDALEANASASFFEASGSAISTGPTGTNVADICFVVPSRR